MLIQPTSDPASSSALTRCRSVLSQVIRPQQTGCQSAASPTEFFTFARARCWVHRRADRGVRSQRPLHPF